MDAKNESQAGSTGRLLDFLMEVSKDPSRAKAIAQNPDQELAAAGLSSEEAEAVKSMDSERIKSLLVSQQNNPNEILIVIGAVIKF